MEIRIAKEEDVIALYELNEMFNGRGSTTKGLLRDSILRNPQETVAIAYDNKEAVGFICGQLFMSMCYSDYYAEITELFVKEEFRYKGVGKGLISFMESYFKERNIKYFQLFTGRKNVNAQRFYERIGYTISDELMYRKRDSSFS